MTAEEDKGGDVPAHDKDPRSHSHNCKAGGAHRPQVFRGKKTGIRPIAFHKSAVHRTEKDKPEYQQDLELLYMQQQ